MTEQRARLAVRERSQGRCEACGRQPAQGVHHRQPRSAGGSWSPANLLDLCGSGTTGCHGLVEAHLDPIGPARTPDVSTYELGLHVRRGQNPADVPVRLNHPVYGAGWWWLNDDGTLTWHDPGGAPWCPPRAAEQLPTHKHTRVVRRG